VSGQPFESAARYMRRKQFERAVGWPSRVQQPIFGPVDEGTMLDVLRRGQERYERAGGTLHSFGECRTRTVNGFPM